MKKPELSEKEKTGIYLVALITVVLLSSPIWIANINDKLDEWSTVYYKKPTTIVVTNATGDTYWVYATTNITKEE